MSSTMSMVDAERLASTVKEYPIIYDRGHPLFHKKEEKLSAWNSVANLLGMENGESVCILSPDEAAEFPYVRQYKVIESFMLEKSIYILF